MWLKHVGNLQLHIELITDPLAENGGHTRVSDGLCPMESRTSGEESKWTVIIQCEKCQRRGCPSSWSGRLPGGGVREQGGEKEGMKRVLGEET